MKKAARLLPRIRAATRSTRGLPSFATELNHSTPREKIALISINSPRRGLSVSCAGELFLTLVVDPQEWDEHKREGCECCRDKNERC